MKFKQIEIFGFKSFANKIEVEIDNGVIAIIGPNGCGKSNFADAIRWVLGEQSAKTLRGGNMQDVIFSGTEKKKALSYCEVTLRFTDIEPSKEIPYTEMSISRRLYRSGESTYLLNNEKTRLKDIIEKLHILGIGKDGYSIIGQGKVEEIMNSKPIDRRAVFEEATGIAHLRIKKVDIERKLEATESNLFNFSNIIAEIERQIGPLEKEAQRAEKYSQIKEDLKKHDLNIYHAKSVETQKRVEELTELLAVLVDELAEKKKHGSVLIDNRNNINAQLDNIDNSLRQLNDKLLILSVDSEKSSGRLNALTQRLNFLRDKNAELLTDTDNCNFLIVDDTGKIENFKLEKEQLAKDMINHQEQLKEFSKELEDVNIKLQSYDSELRESQNEMINSMSKLVEINANLSEYKTKRAYMQNQQYENKQKLITLSSQRDEFAKSADDYVMKCDSLTKKRGQIYSEINSYKNENIELQQKYDEREKQSLLLNNLVTKLETEQRLYAQIVNSNTGLADAVKQLIADSNKNDELSIKIEGVVCTSMKVEQKYETAILSALGGSVNNVITQTKQTGKFLINYLKEKKYGRATFLPLDTIRPRVWDDRYKRALNMQGALGLACDLISYNNNLDNIYRGLLGSTLIVDNLQNAIIISESCNSNVRIVTLDGDEISTTGSMTGGGNGNSGNNLLSHKRQLKETEDRLEKAKVDYEKAYKQFSEIKNLIEANNKLIESGKQSVAALDIELTEANALSKQHIDRRDELFISQCALKVDIEKAEKELTELENNINAVERINSSLEHQKQTDAGVTGKKKQEFDTLSKQSFELNSQMNLLRTSLATNEMRIRGLQDNINYAEGQISINKSKIQTNAEKIAENNQEIDNAINLSSQEEMGNENFAKIIDVKREITDYDERKAQLKIEVSRVDDEIQTLNQRVLEISDRKGKTDSKLENIQLSFEELKERTMSRYSAIFDGDFEAGVMRYVVDDYNLLDGIKIAETYNRQLNAMGDINHRAADQIREQRERLHENYRQRDDVNKAKEDILLMLKDITTEMTRCFNEGFAKIQENFTEIFRKLFGGGFARLVIEKSESGDPLEDGVEIEAQPPGKSLKRLSLLSGGEKALTAIAILFSILSINSMPFCVLDEIEAALDESNVERFARYLKNYSSRTQFIVITHRKPTMELADALYGVTMEQGSGISKVLSVTLKDAVENYVDESMVDKAEIDIE